MNHPMKFILVASLLAGTAGTALAANDRFDMGDHAEHQAFMSAPISLAMAISAAETETGARAISAEFEEEDGQYIYSVELLDANGQEIEAEIDVVTAQIIKVEADDESDDRDGE